MNTQQILMVADSLDKVEVIKPNPHMRKLSKKLQAGARPKDVNKFF